MKFSAITFVALLSTASAFMPAAVPVRSAVQALNVKTGAAGKPAKSKEEDLELTTQIILEAMNNDADNEGIVDDDDE